MIRPRERAVRSEAPRSDQGWARDPAAAASKRVLTLSRAIALRGLIARSLGLHVTTTEIALVFDGLSFGDAVSISVASPFASVVAGAAPVTAARRRATTLTTAPSIVKPRESSTCTRTQIVAPRRTRAGAARALGEHELVRRRDLVCASDVRPACGFSSTTTSVGADATVA